MTYRIKISLGTVWEETIGFVRAEASLLLPLAPIEAALRAAKRL